MTGFQKINHFVVTFYTWNIYCCKKYCTAQINITVSSVIACINYQKYFTNCMCFAMATRWSTGFYSFHAWLNGWFSKIWLHFHVNWLKNAFSFTTQSGLGNPSSFCINDAAPSDKIDYLRCNFFYSYCSRYIMKDLWNNWVATSPCVMTHSTMMYITTQTELIYTTISC